MEQAHGEDPEKPAVDPVINSLRRYLSNGALFKEEIELLMVQDPASLFTRASEHADDLTEQGFDAQGIAYRLQNLDRASRNPFLWRQIPIAPPPPKRSGSGSGYTGPRKSKYGK